MPKTKQFDETEVLKKAKEVFNLKGYNGTSMDDLVKATGLSRSSIYNTFGDKHGLFIRTLQIYCSDQKNTLNQILCKTTSSKKKLSIFFHSVVNDIMEDKKRQGCLLLNAGMELTCVDKKIANMTYEVMEEVEELFYKWIKEGQDSGEISKRFSAKALAKHLYNSFAGLKTTGRNRPDKNILQDIVKINLSLLED
jgi:TetR/AcrR family transcriptional repressor of nem operon